jgi:hypothetical protein
MAGAAAETGMWASPAGLHLLPFLIGWFHYQLMGVVSIWIFLEIRYRRRYLYMYEHSLI